MNDTNHRKNQTKHEQKTKKKKMMPNQNKTSTFFFVWKKWLLILQIFTLQKLHNFIFLKETETGQCFMYSYIYIKHTNIFNFFFVTLNLTCVCVCYLLLQGLPQLHQQRSMKIFLYFFSLIIVSWTCCTTFLLL